MARYSTGMRKPSGLQVQLQHGDPAEKIGASSTRHGQQAEKTTSASAIQPAPAVIPSVHCGTRIRD
jgi:hypothetical protein